MSLYGTVGVSSAFQLVDETGAAAFRGIWDHSGSEEEWIFTMPEEMNQWPAVEYPADVTSRLFEIRLRSFARLGEAWSVLADL